MTTTTVFKMPNYLAADRIHRPSGKRGAAIHKEAANPDPGQSFVVDYTVTGHPESPKGRQGTKLI